MGGPCPRAFLAVSAACTPAHIFTDDLREWCGRKRHMAFVLTLTGHDLITPNLSQTYREIYYTHVNKIAQVELAYVEGDLCSVNQNACFPNLLY